MQPFSWNHFKLRQNWYILFLGGTKIFRRFVWLSIIFLGQKKFCFPEKKFHIILGKLYREMRLSWVNSCILSLPPEHRTICEIHPDLKVMTAYGTILFCSDRTHRGFELKTTRNIFESGVFVWGRLGHRKWQYFLSHLIILLLMRHFCITVQRSSSTFPKIMPCPGR